MKKIEMGVIVTVIIAIITGALYIGKLQGRVEALEAEKSITAKERKDIVLGAIEDAKEGTNQRISSLEDNWIKDRNFMSEFELPIGDSGDWGRYRGARQCPNNHYVCGLELRTEPAQGKGDDTGITGVKFQCCAL